MAAWRRAADQPMTTMSEDKQNQEDAETLLSLDDADAVEIDPILGDPRYRPTPVRISLTRRGPFYLVCASTPQQAREVHDYAVRLLYPDVRVGCRFFHDHVLGLELLELSDEDILKRIESFTCKGFRRIERLYFNMRKEQIPAAKRTGLVSTVGIIKMVPADILLREAVLLARAAFIEQAMVLANFPQTEQVTKDQKDSLSDKLEALFWANRTLDQHIKSLEAKAQPESSPEPAICP